MKMTAMYIEVPNEMTEEQISSLRANLEAQCEAYDESPESAHHYPSVTCWFGDL